MIISLYIIILLWVVSVFSFARLRISLAAKKVGAIAPQKDWVCLAYLRISGALILFAIMFLVKGH